MISSAVPDSRERQLVIALERHMAGTDSVVTRDKIRVSLSSGQILTGQELQTEVLQWLRTMRTEEEQEEDGVAVVEIYNARQEVFVSLLDPRLKDTNIIETFGTRIRCSIGTTTAPTSSRLALKGRFFPYDPDHGMEFARTRLLVKELSNIPGAGTGLSVWDGAMLLARYLEQRPELVQSKRILELGAGTGLVGIAAGLLGAREVLLTDLPYTMSLMQDNVRHHQKAFEKSGCSRVVCATCDWFHPPTLASLVAASSMMAEQHYSTTTTWQPDVILLADCVWILELVPPLLQTIQMYRNESKSPVKVVVSYQRRGKGAHEAFWNGVRGMFSRVNEADHSMMGIAKPECLSIFELD